MNDIIRFISALVLMFFIQMPSVAAEKREWRLEQIHAMRGKTVIYFTASELKIVTSSKRELVAKAPDWNVRSLRRDDKVISHLPKDEFLHKRQYRLKGGFENRSQPIATEKISAVKADLYRIYDETLAVGRISGIAPEIWDIITNYYSEPRVDGVLLRATGPQPDRDAPMNALSLTEESGKGVKFVSLTTVPYNAADFSVPTGYKTVPHDIGISFSSDKKREAEALLQDIGVGVELGHSPQKKAPQKRAK